MWGLVWIKRGQSQWLAPHLDKPNSFLYNGVQDHPLEAQAECFEAC
jgi:hypothetical protein